MVHKVDVKGNVIPEAIEKQAEEENKIEVQKSPEQMGVSGGSTTEGSGKSEEGFLSAKIKQLATVPERYFEKSPLESTLEQDRIKFEQEQAHERTFLEKPKEEEH